MLFAKLWELGQRFLIHQLQNDAIFRISSLLQITKFDNGEDMAGFKEFVKFLYRDELRDSAVRRVAADKIALDIQSADLGLYCWFEDMPARLWYDMTMYLKEARELLVVKHQNPQGHEVVALGLHEANHSVREKERPTRGGPGSRGRRGGVLGALGK